VRRRPVWCLMVMRHGMHSNNIISSITETFFPVGLESSQEDPWFFSSSTLPESGENSYTAKERSSQTSMRSAQKLRLTLTDSLEPTKGFPTYQLICEYILLTSSILLSSTCLVCPHKSTLLSFYLVNSDFGHSYLNWQRARIPHDLFH